MMKFQIWGTTSTMLGDLIRVGWVRATHAWRAHCIAKNQMFDFFQKTGPLFEKRGPFCEQFSFPLTYRMGFESLWHPATYICFIFIQTLQLYHFFKKWYVYHRSLCSFLHNLNDMCIIGPWAHNLFSPFDFWRCSARAKGVWRAPNQLGSSLPT